MTKQLRLEDVDGTVPGVAMLVSTDLSQGEDARPMHSVFVESDTCVDPHMSCQNLWRSIAGDWPGHTTGIILNERARYLMAQRRMREMFGESSVLSPEEYVEDHDTQRTQR